LRANFCGALPFPSVSENKKAAGAFLGVLSTPVARVVSAKLCPILEGDQRDGAIYLVTLLVESGSGVPVGLGVVEDPCGVEEVGIKDVGSGRTALDLFPLELDRHHALAAHSRSEGEDVSSVLLVLNGWDSLLTKKQSNQCYSS